MTKRFHYQRDRFNQKKSPKLAVLNFKEAQEMGMIPANQTREHVNKAYTKKLAKKKAARKARKKNRH